MSLVQLIYTSDASENLLESEVLEILRKAQFKNQLLKISGLLLFKHGRFIQLLEGDEAHVQALFETIAKDPRHRNVIMRERFTVDRVSMPTWAMGYFSPQADEAVRQANLFVMSSPDVRAICGALPERIGSRFIEVLQDG